MIALSWFFIYSRQPDPVEFFEKRRSQKIQFDVESSWHERGSQMKSLRIEGFRKSGNFDYDVTFDAFECKPQDVQELLPAFILIGGINTGRDAIHIIAKRPEIARLGVFLSLDYPYDGPLHFEALDFIRNIPRIKKSLYDTVEAVRLAIDYLESLDYVDEEQITIIGVSLGAFYSVFTGGVDDRPQAVISVMGGGHLRSLFDWNLRRSGHLSSRLLSFPAAVLATWMIRPLEPVDYVSHISPRFYLQINGTKDEMIPRFSALTLYDSAKEPKKLVWVDSWHIMPDTEDLIDQIIAITYEEFRAVGLL
ncbi:hypothetical protein CEE37_11155 [candidate division LCP-89 bacterium B3_LCP]|uniref:Peptidase S9 prolyl oligopeptidase catalytic domain-containing protein n=1 Tax=candidate division LCP-89 bacterium B3_LCP TaxID=2012998 RepID=A0A532UYK5_UNCL8|nr:MAG: hypothetical protein CEE37_11155 [candidate division LCP-89 bacterium B3_LCP]